MATKKTEEESYAVSEVRGGAAKAAYSDAVKRYYKAKADLLESRANLRIADLTIRQAGFDLVHMPYW